MRTITITLPEKLRERMQEHDEVNWSAYFRKSAAQFLEELELLEEARYVRPEYLKKLAEIEKQDRKAIKRHRYKISELDKLLK
ncbi:MAG: hypothetical protein J4432_01610 [DPANN group archaeon]|nr:hypothetical protein [DPANN group archaeon]